ncbi:hypothetical protein [Rhodopirellula europaea]|uniref:hypothetical protein n=1 Tax=Rhodopirellula europaea TaxID=1263866 RepID=UPI003D2CE6A9|tara:strand:- start:8515 stop:8910 length:396 start_codon:yes stop_codon:yes gene_type:complete
MQAIIPLARMVSGLYLVGLSFVLLFVGNPVKFVDDPQFVSAYKTVEPGLHVGLFAGLALLVAASQLRLPFMVHAGLLTSLAAISELVQIWLPNRTPRMGCFIEDIIGLAIGAIAWFVFLELITTLNRVRRR